MTPVDDNLKNLYREYITRFGIESFYPPQSPRAHTDAQKFTSIDVDTMTRSALAQYPDVDAIYFQGAMLDPLPILDRLESDLEYRSSPAIRQCGG